MMAFIRKHFRMYTGQMSEEEQWEDTKELVNLCMMLLLGLSLLRWGGIL